MSKGSCFAKWGNLFWILGKFVLHSIPYFTIKRTYQQADFDNGSFLLVSMNHFNFWQFLWNHPAVSLKPDHFWHFFWNHLAVLGGFRAKIWPKMTKSKVSNKTSHIFFILWGGIHWYFGQLRCPKVSMNVSMKPPHKKNEMFPFKTLL